MEYGPTRNLTLPAIIDSGDSKEWSRLKRHKRPRAPAATIFCRPFTHIHPQVLLTAQSACGWTSVTHF
ncbi:hypothetical protein CH63R_00795 [Colletotrichum higginsianum IMI 349063]|uniref:Uncharacterized protein n=1 Tax=Colletotrichum higginsianum (strain IMI 349063) TaxID=759273 RepID=A0A1B7YU83_COLHI|nr:hypothetical protein CH63R_00795 [Colletotrichum higginsianum IMI 349063]OBR15615.1 hypothetical protein CH63R_00795 [Colletotrichum higginsianum IMI 349063]